MSCCWSKRRKSAEDQLEGAESACGSCALRAIGWTSVAVGVAALGLFVGRELRLRYVIRHRTPSDFFSHAGEDFNAEFGVGI